MREQVVDFTKPFMGSGIAAIMKTRHLTQLGIRSVRDLAHQSTMKYGVIDGAATKDFFRMSADPDYVRMWAEIATHSGQVRTMEEGIERVLASSDEHPWALLSETAALSAQETCDTTIVSSDTSRGHALATPPGDTYMQDRLTLAILEMIEDGDLTALRLKWFQPPDCDHSANGAAGAKRFLFPPQ